MYPLQEIPNINLVDALCDSLSRAYCAIDMNQKVEPSLTPLIILLIVNILLIIANFFVDHIKRRWVITTKKDEIIAAKLVMVEEEIYSKFLKLVSYQKDELDDFLSCIKDTQKVLQENKLYMSKAFFKISDKFLDYFKIICFDFRKKNLMDEEKFLEQLFNEFRK